MASRSLARMRGRAGLSIPSSQKEFCVCPLATSPWPPMAKVSSRFGAGCSSKTAPINVRHDICVPRMAESMSEGTMAALTKQIGDHAEEDEEIASIETDKIDVSGNAPKKGRIVEWLVNEGDVVAVSKKIAVLEETDGAQEQPQTGGARATDERRLATAEQSQSKEKEKLPEVFALSSYSETPEVGQPRRNDSAATADIEPDLKGSQYKERVNQAAALPRTTNSSKRHERVERMPRIRQTIAKRLKESQNRTASLTTMNRVDVSSLMKWREANKERVLKRHGVKLGYMGAFTKAATLAAQEIPLINGAMDLENEVITYRDFVDVSIAVSTPRGLVTPVVQNCDSMDIIQIEREIARLAGKARENKLTMDDLAGGNFSISNPGIFGSLFGTPVINYPQSAVFNMNSIKKEPVAINGRVEVRPLMYITLTYDHRLIDGREAVSFLNIVKNYIENPASMLLAASPAA